MSTATTHIKTEKQLVPALRFKEYVDKWSKEKIQTLIDKEYIVGHLDGNHGELYPKSEEFVESGIPYVSANDFIDGITLLESCKFLTEERAATFKKGIAKDGDVLFAHNATVGPTAVLTTNYPYVILSTTATYYRCNPEKLINYFLKNYFQTDFFIRQYFRVKSQSTRDQVPITQQRKFDAFLPSLPEQQKIASFLSAVDEKIQQLTKKKELLEQYKKGGLQQLFSGQLRFKDENGNPYPDWEEKRLGDIADVKRGAGSQYITYVNSSIDGIRLVRITDFLGGEPVYVKETEDIKRFTLEKDDILIAGTGATAGITFKIPDNLIDLAFSYNAPRIRIVNGNSEFTIQYLKSSIILRQQNALFTGNAQPFLDTKAIKNFKMYIPYSVEEQQKIATYLASIDTKIENVNQQITQTQTFKKGLLQQLFI